MRSLRRTAPWTESLPAKARVEDGAAEFKLCYLQYRPESDNDTVKYCDERNPSSMPIRCREVFGDAGENDSSTAARP